MMPIPFTCPHCGTFTNVDDHYAGQTGPCSKCGETITVPTAGEGSALPRSPQKSGGAIVAVLIVFGLLCLGVPVLLFMSLTFRGMPMPARVTPATPQTRCTNNLKQIAIALHNYHDTYKTFPPAVITDEEGNPRYSWRTAILPFMEQMPLYDAYDPNVPWDDPVNQSAIMTQIPAYQCPEDPLLGPYETSYVMITGEGTVGGQPNEGTRFRDIVDGTSNTIMVVEVVGAGIQWAEPRDLTLEELSMQLNDGSGSGPSSQHPGGVNVLMCDGSVRFLTDGIDPAMLENLLRRDDGNAIGEF